MAAPRKAAAPKAPELKHAEACAEPRVEKWESGPVTVVRCQECGARRNH